MPPSKGVQGAGATGGIANASHKGGEHSPSLKLRRAGQAALQMPPSKGGERQGTGYRPNLLGIVYIFAYICNEYVTDMRKRFLYHEIVRYLDHKNALIITGMRQVGKTTLMKQIYDDVKGVKLWFDFDNPLDTMHFESDDYNGIFNDLLRQCGGEKPVIFIDEIQNFPKITSIIKYHIDKYNLKYIVTGSSNFYLRNLFPESLSGRKFLFVLKPLDFREMIFFTQPEPAPPNGSPSRTLDPEALSGKPVTEFKPLEGLYDEFIEYGGFPEVIMTKDNNVKKMVLRNIFASFFEKDLTLMSEIKDIRELRNLILLLLPRTGNMLDITRLASELGISRVKVYDYLELLQGTFFLYLVPKYSNSIDRSVAGGKKVYFSDTGLLNIMGRVNDGQLFENTVANQLSVYGDLSFYNKRNSAEIDFILNKEIAFEAKLNAIHSDRGKVLKTASQIGIKNCFVVCKNYSAAEGTINGVFM